ncbi:uncharacterized protein BXIN_0880 [Babesia sp. Xinjiang]|uniref:uncharacterized protein n=1 Tax=Babesia sp. Xinjiang TaxID=462227 RepID=UPI000A24D784|nr:uncharacterized protein BXIN_0880 [Babesia sp. Xinjiang]ORM41221.1 hypothetical protein BXIN_0880 [Babesia sp. Xinjiang]
MAVCSRSVCHLGAIAPSGELCSRVSKFDVESFFKLLGRRRRRRTLHRYLISLKELHKMFNEMDSEVNFKERMLQAGGRYRYQRTLPKPTFDMNTRCSRPFQHHYLPFIGRETSLVKQMCGLSISPRRVENATLLYRCMNIQHLELRSILYKFVHSYVDTLDKKELAQLTNMLNLELSGKGEMLLRYLMGKSPVDHTAVGYDIRLEKLLLFLWKCNPALLRINGPLEKSISQSK